MQNKLYRTATPKACFESAAIAGGAEPQLRAPLAGPPDHPGHRHRLEPWPRARHLPTSALPRPAGCGSLRSRREHEDLDGGEEVLGPERCGRASTGQEPMFSCSVTIIESLIMSDSVQPVQGRADTARREFARGGRGAGMASRDAQFHPAGKPDSAVRTRGRCAPSCTRGSHGAVARGSRARTYPSLLSLIHI